LFKENKNETLSASFPSIYYAKMDAGKSLLAKTALEADNLKTDKIETSCINFYSFRGRSRALLWKTLSAIPHEKLYSPSNRKQKIAHFINTSIYH
jgi:hypothetical protein